ncbi:glycosyltransferase [Stappia stellulata]|uniref:glycosyltransferase n=1 Tax=Stappia stellulata TaxID=71235 RepID=UPI00041DE6BD|nr:glycosyltransferase [Stappia stellulata]
MIGPVLDKIIGTDGPDLPGLRIKTPAGLPLATLRARDRSDTAAAPSPPLTVHLLWVEGDLCRLGHLACASFLAHGYDVQLWNYRRPTNAPEGVTLRDGREILPETRIFRYQNGSLSAFSNLFRYAVLARHGGLWADTDVVCLMEQDALQAAAPDGFLVSERIRGKRRVQLNSNVIYHPAPQRGDVIDLAFRFADGFDPARLEWGDCGPKLLTTLVDQWPALAPTLMAARVANPVDYWACPRALLSPRTRLGPDTAFLHCYNEMWRRAGIDTNAPFPPNTLIGRIAARYD